MSREYDDSTILATSMDHRDQGCGDGHKAGTSGESEAARAKPGARTGGLFRLNSLNFLPPNTILPRKMVVVDIRI